MTTEWSLLFTLLLPMCIPQWAGSLSRNICSRVREDGLGGFIGPKCTLTQPREPCIYIYIHDIIGHTRQAHLFRSRRGRSPSRYRLVASNDAWSSALEYVKGKQPKRKWAEKETVGAPASCDLGGRGFLSFKRQMDDIVEQLIPWCLKFVADYR